LSVPRLHLVSSSQGYCNVRYSPGLDTGWKASGVWETSLALIIAIGDKKKNIVPSFQSSLVTRRYSIRIEVEQPGVNSAALVLQIPVQIVYQGFRQGRGFTKDDLQLLPSEMELVDDAGIFQNNKCKAAPCISSSPPSYQWNVREKYFCTLMSIANLADT